MPSLGQEKAGEKLVKGDQRIIFEDFIKSQNLILSRPRDWSFYLKAGDLASL
jgi:hypothetical protein